MRYMVEGQPVRPANVGQIVAINQGRLPLTMAEPAAERLTPAGAARRLGEEEGLCLLDIRDPAAFGAAHPDGAVNVQLSSPEFEQRVGWVLGPQTRFLLLAERDGDIPRALHNLAFVGLDGRAEGWMAGGMGAWMAEGLPHETVPQVSVRQLRETLEEGSALHWSVVDVREDEEWEEGHIADAFHVNYKSMGEGAGDFPFSPNEALAVICAAGMRSSTAASLLRRHGFPRVLNVTGGMGAWKAAGHETVGGR